MPPKSRGRESIMIPSIFDSAERASSCDASADGDTSALDPPEDSSDQAFQTVQGRSGRGEGARRDRREQCAAENPVLITNEIHRSLKTDLRAPTVSLSVGQ